MPKKEKGPYRGKRQPPKGTPALTLAAVKQALRNFRYARERGVKLATVDAGIKDPDAFLIP